MNSMSSAYSISASGIAPAAPRTTEQAEHERSGSGRRRQGLSRAMVAAQARSETAGSRRADCQSRYAVRAGCRRQCRAGVRPLQPAEVEDMTATTDITAFLRKG